jgi:hypothetical protein
MVERPEIKLHLIVTKFKISLAGNRFGGSEKGIGLPFRIAVDKVKYTVRARAGPVDEIGPGHRALRRDAGPENAISILGAQPLEIGQPAGVHHGFAQPGIHAVKTYHDYSFFRGRCVSLSDGESRLSRYAGHQCGSGICRLFNKSPSADVFHGEY